MGEISKHAMLCNTLYYREYLLFKGFKINLGLQYHSAESAYHPIFDHAEIPHKHFYDLKKTLI